MALASSAKTALDAAIVLGLGLVYVVLLSAKTIAHGLRQGLTRAVPRFGRTRTTAAASGGSSRVASVAERDD